MRKQSLFILLLFTVFTHAIGQSTSKIFAKQISEFDAYVENARKAWHAPGLAVTVVKNNEVIFKKGYGVKELNTSNPVDLNTLFACASTTKLMTATCMGMLVDEGKIKWDDRVMTYLPEFQLYDPYVTRELRIRDLFTHNSGVGNTDFLWSIMDIPADQVLEKMRMVEPSYSFRSSFIYQNIFYLAAGEIIEKISGEPWSVFVKKRIFDPLGMKRTVPLLKDIPDSNQTKPHQEVDGKILVIEDMSADNIGPAGSAWSSIDDIGKWVKCMLDSSKYEGGRLVKPATWMEMTKPQVIVPASEFYPTASLTKPNWTTYGFGWFQHDYKGKKVNFHTGSLPGSIAIHGQIPEEKIAVYVYGNLDHAEVRHAIMYKAFDVFALGGNRDWSAEFLTLYNGLKEAGEKATRDFEAKRVKDTKPSLSLSEYSGKYTDPLYGTIEVTVAGNNLVLNANQFVKAILSHWNFDTFRGPYEKVWFGNAQARFELGNTGKVEKLNFDGLIFTKE